MLENLDKKQKVIIMASIVFLVIIVFTIAIALNGSKKNTNKIDEVFLKASVIDENTLNLEIDAPNNKMINYTLEKSSSLNFSEKEEVKGSTNTEKVQIETKDIENTTYYRVKLENIETKEIIYSNVISISPKEIKEGNLNDEKVLDSSMNNNELEIEERKEEKSTSKSYKSEEKTQESSEKSEESISEQENSEELSISSNSSVSKASSSKSSSSKASNSKTNSLKNSNNNYDNNYEQSKYVSSKSSKSSSSSKNQSSKSSNSNTSSKTNVEIKNEEKIIEVRYIKLSTSNVELDLSVINTKKLDVTITPENATDKKITWLSENEEIAKVNQDGTIIAVSNGQTNIIARSGKKEAKCKVKVITTATGMKLDKTKIKLDITTNKQEQIIAEVEPETATNYKITWSSEDTKIARVDSSGKITGVSNGKTKIIATMGNIKKECEVVVETSPKSLLFNKKNIELDINQNNQEKIKTKITPSTSSYTKVKWKSSNTKVATVDRTGKVTAVGEGIAKITAEIEGKEDIKNTIIVNVNSTISNIELNKRNIDINLRNPSTNEIIAKLKNGEIYKSIIWTTSNESVVKVVGNGLKANINAVGEGNAIVSVTIDGKTSSCNVNVIDNIDIQKIEFNKADFVLDKNLSVTATAKIYPENATNKNLTYSISDSNVASVLINSNGKIKITGKNAGNATIIIKPANESNVISKINVTVINKNTDIYYKYKSEIYRIVKSRINLNVFSKIIVKNDLIQFGKEPYPDKCLSFAEGYSYFLAEGTATELDSVIKSNLANYKYGYFKTYSNDDKSIVLEKMYDEIIRGYAPIVHVNGNKEGTSRHYITVVGVNENVPKLELQESDFLVIDCARFSLPKNIK